MHIDFFDAAGNPLVLTHDEQRQVEVQMALCADPDDGVTLVALGTFGGGAGAELKRTEGLGLQLPAISKVLEEPAGAYKLVVQVRTRRRPHVKIRLRVPAPMGVDGGLVMPGGKRRCRSH